MSDGTFDCCGCNKIDVPMNHLIRLDKENVFHSAECMGKWVRHQASLTRKKAMHNAAPDMLAALKLLLNALEENIDCSNPECDCEGNDVPKLAVTAALKAIRKAEGKAK